MVSDNKTLYREFYRTLVDSNSNPLVTRIGAIILNNFEDICKTKNVMGQRGNRLASLIQEEMNKQVVVGAGNRTEPSSQAIKQLTKLTVSCFRGFQTTHEFEFGKKYTFIYGPNGTGKTSLVDALEYALNGRINEADAREIPTERYISNVYSGEPSKINLMGIDKTGHEVLIEPDPEAFSLSILERNRIDSFARISVGSSKSTMSRLADLVGLNQWNNFVKEFPMTIETRFVLKDEQKISLEHISSEIATLKGDLANQKELFEQATHAAADLRKKYAEKSNDLLKKELVKQLASYKTSQSKMQVIPVLDTEKITQLVVSREKIEKLQEQKNAAVMIVNKFKQELTLAELAKAVQQVEDDFPNECPVCESKIYDENGKLLLAADPYRHADNVQNDAREALESEKKLKEAESKLNREKITYSNLVFGIQSALTANSASQKELQQYVSEIGESHGFKTLSDDLIRNIEQEFEKINAQIEKNNQKYQYLSANVERISNEIVTIDSASSMGADFDQRKIAGEEKLATLSIHEQKLRQIEKDSRAFNDAIKEYISAYKTYYKCIQKFTKNKTVKAVADLNDRTKKFYNAINFYENDSEKLLDLKLPDSEKSTVMITFNDAKKDPIDALEVLSEGHLRVLGLSILLAKAIRDRQQFIIFDDVVNSIDDEHRLAIAELITGNEKSLKHIQWIITTHGQQFKELLDNLTKGSGDYDRTSNKRSIVFREKEADADIYSFSKTDNYLTLAEIALGNSDLRSALANSRRAVEMIRDRLWNLYTKRFGDRIIATVDLAKPSIDLHTAITLLNSYTKKVMLDSRISEEEKELLVPIKSRLTAITDDNNWTQLNKGTHVEEDGAELHAGKAKKIIKEIVGPLYEILFTLQYQKNDNRIELPEKMGMTLDDYKLKFNYKDKGVTLNNE